MELIIEQIHPSEDLIFIIDKSRFRKGVNISYFDEADVEHYFGSKIYKSFLKGKNEFNITKKQYFNLCTE